MSKNLIPVIAEMLGVKLGEEFKINLCPNVLFKFDMSGVLTQEQGEASWHSANCGVLQELIYGSFEIIKLPWKPKKGDVYYTFSFGGLSEEWVVVKQQWDAHPYERALLDKGWVYRTCEKAEAALPTVAKEMGVEYEI